MGLSVSGDSKEKITSDSSGEYEAEATFGGGSWDYDGTGSLSQGNSSSNSYSGSYTNANATVIAQRSNSNLARVDRVVNYELNSGGVWEKSSATHKSSGNGFASWSYSTEGLAYTANAPYPSSTGSVTGTQSNGCGADSSYDYLKTATYSGSSWTYGGYARQSHGTHSSRSFSASGDYEDYWCSGEQSTNGNRHSNETYTTYSTVDSATGALNAPTVTIAWSGNSHYHSSYSGEGTYGAFAGELWSLEPVSKGGHDDRFSSFDLTRTQSPSGKWTSSGSGEISQNTDSNYSYSGSSYYSTPYRIINVNTNGNGSSTEKHIQYYKPTGSSFVLREDQYFQDSQGSETFNYAESGVYDYFDTDSHIIETVHYHRGLAPETNNGAYSCVVSGDWYFYADNHSYEVTGQSHTVQGYEEWPVSDGPDNWHTESSSYGPMQEEGPGSGASLYHSFYSGGYYLINYGQAADYIVQTLHNPPCYLYPAAASTSMMTLSVPLESMTLASTTGDSVALEPTETLAASETGMLGVSTLSAASSVSLTSSMSLTQTNPFALFSSTRSTGGSSFGTYVTSTGGRTFDSAGRLISLTDANFAVTRFGYDAAGNLAELTDPLQNTTRWTYDEQNRLTQETDELGESRNYVYDDAGDLVQYIDRTGVVRQYTYDAQHRVVAETWYASLADADAGQNSLNSIQYAYDSAGRIIFEADNYSSLAYAYNDAGQITSTTTSSVSTPTATLDYEYNSAGNRTRAAATIGGVCDYVEDYAYDSAGRLVSVVQHGVEGGAAVAEKRLDFAYNDAGQIVSIDRYLGDQLAVRADYSYDSLDRMIGLVYHQGDTVLNSYQWTYSGDGQSVGWVASPTANDVWKPNGGLPAEFVEQGMLPVHDTTGVTAALMSGGYENLSRLVSVTSAADGTATYSYDAVGQLTAADYDYQPDESYTYDANGNRTGDGYIIGPDNRLLSDGTYWYTYDAEGNRTARFIDVNANTILDSGDTDITQYTWDARNRLTKVTDYEIYGGDPTQIVDYLYDLENRWIGKRIDSDGDGMFDSQESYVYDGNQMVLRFEGDDLSHRYLWQPDAVDQLMADEQIEKNEVVWALTDHLGTVRDLAVTDAETGETSVVDHITYDAYGNKLSGTNAAVDCLFAFTGRAFDEATEIQNNLNRWYDANNGRWISKDLIGFNGRDINLSRYCKNDPINITDPHGDILPVVVVVVGAWWWFEANNANAPAPHDPLAPSNPFPDPRPAIAAGVMAHGVLKVGKIVCSVLPTAGGASASSYGINLAALRPTATVAAHLAKRPYIGSKALVDLIIQSGKPAADTIMSGALRWQAAGTMNGSVGVYELVIDPKTNRILHFLFRST